jgi:SAM-dependent methyltransferase
MSQSQETLSLGERILLSLAKSVDSPQIGATANYTIGNCLDFAKKALPNFAEEVRDARVADYGCGPGWQAVAMRIQCGATEVVGIDINEKWLNHGRSLAHQFECSDRVTFRHSDSQLSGQFDVVVSLSAFEHYSDPGLELTRMRDLLRVNGKLLLAFAEPWYSHSGSHIGDFTRIPGTSTPLPWVNLFFSDTALLTLRSRFRSDRPGRIEDIEGGLNKMTIRRFEKTVAESGMAIEAVRYFATAGLPVVTRVPILRELLTSAISCVFRKLP